MWNFNAAESYWRSNRDSGILDVWLPPVLILLVKPLLLEMYLSINPEGSCIETMNCPSVAFGVNRTDMGVGAHKRLGKLWGNLWHACEWLIPCRLCGCFLRSYWWLVEQFCLCFCSLLLLVVLGSLAAAFSSTLSVGSVVRCFSVWACPFVCYYEALLDL